MEDTPAFLRECQDINARGAAGRVDNEQAQSFFSRFPLDRYMAPSAIAAFDGHQLQDVTACLAKLLTGTDAGALVLASASPLVEAALAAPQPPLRRLGCEVLPTLVGLPATGTEADRQRWAARLVDMVSDADTGVATCAQRGVERYAASGPQALAALLDASTPCGRSLAQLARSQTPSIQLRAMSCVAAVGSASEAASLAVQRSGLLQPLLAGLAAPDDALACMAALALVKDLVDGSPPAVAALLYRELLPNMPPLLADPTLRSMALPVAASLAHGSLAWRQQHGAAAPGPDAMQTDELSFIESVLSAIRLALDDRRNEGPEAEASALDAAGLLGVSATGAELLSRDAALIRSIAERAMDRAPTPDVKIAALHAAASIAGLERAAEAQTRVTAMLPEPMEAALRAAVYSAAASCSGQSPSEAMLALLHQPFAELRVAVYRFMSALALRPWFAAEVSHHAELKSRLLGAGAEAGPGPTQWRHSCVMSLYSTAQAVLTRLPPSHPDVTTYGDALQPLLPALAAAVAAGPYGTGAAQNGAAAAAVANGQGHHDFLVQTIS